MLFHKNKITNVIILIIMFFFNKAKWNILETLSGSLAQGVQSEPPTTIQRQVTGASINALQKKKNKNLKITS